MDVLNLIKERRSIRKFKKEDIPYQKALQVLEAGRWAPSGLNNQPWRFLLLGGEKKDALANFTHYGSIIREADKVILVFLDKSSSYHYEKDLLAIGACVQNMLLYIHSLGWGACWLGEILNKRNEVNSLLNLKEDLELEAVIALGVPAALPKPTPRKKLKELML